LITLPNTQETITPEHIEKNIGYSKDFNVFELQNAIGKKDVLKANRIVNYFESNPKHSINEVIPILFRYFQNIFKLHYLKDKSKQSIASTLGVNPFFHEYIAHGVRQGVINVPLSGPFRITPQQTEEMVLDALFNKTIIILT